MSANETNNTSLLSTADELVPYHGLWVAVVERRVVDSGKLLRTALRQARSQGYSDPLVFMAPLHYTKKAYYWSSLATRASSA